MDEVLDAGSLEVLAASGSACDDEDGLGVGSLEGIVGRNTVFGILVVAGAEHHDVGTGLDSSLNTFLNGGEAEVVNDLVTGSGEEVATELGTSLTHGQVADGQHEGHGLLFCFLRSEAQCFEV